MKSANAPTASNDKPATTTYNPRRERRSTSRFGSRSSGTGVAGDENLLLGDFFLVDMPGYGYAAAAKAKAARWTELVFAYLRARPNLRRVYLLIDARHGVMAKDGTVLDLLDKAAVSYQAVLTKADKLKAGELVETTAAVAAALKKRPAAHPVIIATSSETGAGIAELRAEIAAIAAPGDPDIPVFTEAH